MVVTLKIATDLYGAKVNYLIDFHSVPSIHELKVKTEAVFTRESEARRPVTAPAELFKIDHIQLFDVVTRGWVELGTNGSKISDGCQLYVFQPPNKWHNDTQGGLPPAIRPPANVHPSTTIERFSPPPCAAASPETAIAHRPSVSPTRHRSIPPPSHESIACAGLALGELVETTHRAHAAVVRTEHDILAQNQHLNLQELKAQESLRVAADASMSLEAAKVACVQARETFAAAAVSVENAKTAERETTTEHLCLVEQMHVLEGRMAAQSTEAARAEHRLTELLRLVAEHKIEVQRHKDLQMKCELDIEASKKRVEETEVELEQAHQEVSNAEQAITAAQEDHQAAVDKEKEAAEELRLSLEETTKAKEGVESTVTALKAAKEVEAMKRAEHMDMQKMVGVAQLKLIAQEEETVKMELKLKEVEGLYKMQELEVERHRELSNRCKADLEAAKEREEQASNAALEAQRAVHKAEDDLMTAETDLEKALIREREAQAASVMAQAEAQRTKAAVQGREQALERAKERETMLEKGLEEAKAMVTAAEARKTAQDAELESCIKKLEELEKLCQEQEEEVGKQRTKQDELRLELSNATIEEQKKGADLAAVQATVSVAQEELLRRQAELAMFQDKENNATTVKLAADGEKAIQSSLLSAAEQQLMTLKEQEMLRRSAEEEAIRAAELQSKLAKSLEADQIELASRRLALEAELSTASTLPPHPTR